MVSSDHGFSTISKESKTSPSAKISYEDTPKDFLPMGFLAIDLAKALKMPLFDPNDKNAPVPANAHPKAGNGLLGKDPAKPDLVIATNGGSDLVYIPGKDRKLVDRTFLGPQIYFSVTVIYLAMSLPLGQLTRLAEARARRGRR